MAKKVFKKREFSPSNAAEQEFARALKRVAKVSGHLVDTHEVDIAALNKAARAYAKALGPWARRQAEKMIAKVSRANSKAFAKTSKDIGRLISSEFVRLDTYGDVSELLKEQVALIQSIPIRAAERVQQLATEAVVSGKRFDEIAKEIAKSGKVSESDAVRIARTEVARSTATINQVRAEAAGATHYVWRTAEDQAVRYSHKRMNGKVFSFNAPPTLSDGTTGNPGTFPNCRCYAEPVFDEEI